MENKMDHTPEQRAIITRMGEVSARSRAVLERHRATQVEAGRTLIGAAVALAVAIEHSNELAPLFQEHDDLFREFLDSL
jgi:hypothetical protein